jgi:hypothetical protein
MTRMHTTAALLANAAQLDLFAAFAATAPALPPAPARYECQPGELAERMAEEAIAAAEAAAEPRDIDDDENEAGELIERAARAADAEVRRREWEAERASIEAAIAANPPEILRWGKREGYGGNYLEIALLRDGQHWRARRDYAMPNMDGGGPFGPAIHGTRDEALVDALRAELRGIASHVVAGFKSSVHHGSEADWIAMAHWCIEQAPTALFGGPDLAAEFEAATTRLAERERLRCAAICADKKTYIGEDGAERSIYSL